MGFGWCKAMMAMIWLPWLELFGQWVSFARVFCQSIFPYCAQSTMRCRIASDMNIPGPRSLKAALPHFTAVCSRRKVCNASRREKSGTPAT